MAWIESHQSLLTHRKTGRLARSLNVSKITAIGHLHAFWWWCLDNTQDGSLADCDAAELADAACWEGDAAAFLAAMLHAGFIDQDDAGLQVHAWDEYTGRLIERRRADAERKRAARSNPGVGHTLPSHPQDIRRTSAGHPTDATRDGVRTVPTVPNHTVPERERDVRAGAHAREGTGATADAAPVSLSLSPVAFATPEAEPEAERANPASANEPETPEAAIHAACVVALGHGPTTGRMRRKWRDGCADLARLNLTPEDIPKLVRQYHAKYGDSIPCEPWNLADHYSELGVSPHVQLYAPVGTPTQANGTNGNGRHPALTPEDAARRKRALLASAGIPVPLRPELDSLGR